jgi:predicted regulator of Ras-like GTPase activity (Roadblock/LC7/MglB family)
VGLDLYQHWGRTCGLVPDSLLHFLDAPEPHENLLSQPKRSLAQIESLIKEMQRREYVAQALMVEIHKKYAIPVACFVFVLIGAPLGVLARRGGFVSGLSLSLGFFLLYWAFLISGEDFADRQLVSPFVAMWSANFIVGSFGIFVFSRVALGRMIPMSLRLPHSWRRLSFESLKKEFQREQKERLEKAWQWLQPQTVGAAQEIPVQIFGKKESADAELHVPEPALPRNPVPSPLSSTASLPQLEFTPIPEVLRNFTKSARADLILLANSNGEPLAFCETPTSLPRPPADLEMIAKLAASQMSTAQIAGQNLDEQEAYTCIFHEGARYNLFIYQISRDFILTALVEKTVALGVVRLHANETVSNLRKFLELFC